MNTFAPTVSYHELGKKNNNRRIWMEGTALIRAGLTPGSLYSVALDPITLTVTMSLVPTNTDTLKAYKQGLLRKVSRRQMSGWVKPIIDICNADITTLFGEYARFRAIARSGSVEFGIHHEDLKKAQREARLKQHLRNGYITKGDAFLGTGISCDAIRTGLAREGLRTKQKWAVEMEAKYLDVATLNAPANYDGATLFCAKVEEVEKELLEPVDLFSFSMACTNHSRQGRVKKSLQCAEQGDEVTSLFGVVAMIDAVNPALMISENVVDARDSITYELLRKELRRRGYHFCQYTLDQRHSGAIDMRKRYWLVAYSEGLDIDPATLIPPTQPRIHATLGDIMQDDSAMTWFPKARLQAREAINKAKGRNFSTYWVDASATTIRSVLRNYTKHQTSQPHIEGAPAGETGTDYYRRLSVTEHADSKRIPRHLAGHASPTIAHEGMGQSIVYFHGVGIAQMLIRPLMQAIAPPPSEVNEAAQLALAF